MEKPRRVLVGFELGYRVVSGFRVVVKSEPEALVPKFSKKAWSPDDFLLKKACSLLDKSCFHIDCGLLIIALIKQARKAYNEVTLVSNEEEMAKGNDILECAFLDRRLNRIFILTAAALVLISIVIIGIVSNMGSKIAIGRLYIVRGPRTRERNASFNARKIL